LASGDDIDEWLPWSHIVLANFKRWLLDIFHGVSPAHHAGLPGRFCIALNAAASVSTLPSRPHRCLL